MRQRKWFLCGKTVNRGIKTNYQETFESGIPGIIGVLGIIGKVAARNQDGGHFEWGFQTSGL
jgi:hypothetical protein